MEATERKLKKSVKIRLRKEAEQKFKEENAGRLGDSAASLNNVPTSPRKMRMVADLIRGERVNRALNILKFEAKEGAARLEKLLLSGIANWQARNEDERLEDADLYVKEVFVGGGRMLKRLRPAPQGRAHRIRKRSNHVTLLIASYNQIGEETITEEEEVVEEVTNETDN